MEQEPKNEKELSREERERAVEEALVKAKELKKLFFEKLTKEFGEFNTMDFATNIEANKQRNRALEIEQELYTLLNRLK